ncbi:hypothetical protein A2856_03195 [Candidatus Uhrbacteria bacterium RIFCSPHIGHO2_01_FULL_63_20]|uniref:Phosphatidic acid phosphatase type 2/haloperoxidase domain-containing protein n=1 Tax=Candidatus Uhrbacteria bacterium RIFCSPHIGHO2_01_FULL_63_20 TaxID=1802385 RepID=A0A1F7TL96_9BACT|nr:MAG: hypothetical protein A2856_03195 [Candidatus Uhrbacteria bacterium RIFCSPHIGHO2_01_FULL_63_20]
MKRLVDSIAIWCARYLIVALLIAAALAGSSLIKELLVSILAAWGFAVLLQLALRRPRPFRNGEQALIKMWVETPSFPSAHAAISFAVAGTFLWSQGGQAPAFAVAATLLCWARVRVRVHYLSDVAVGAALGLAVSYGASSFV